VEDTVRACVITGYGINADEELQEAFRLAGASPERRHVRELLEERDPLGRYRILAFPGGFSFGDHLGSGLVFAGLCRGRLKDALERFIGQGNLVIGICNGFQVLVKLGILPNLSGRWEQEVSLVHNDSGVFENRWVRVRTEPVSPCVWTRGIDAVELPVRHGEGRFVAATDEILGAVEARGLVALRYVQRWGPGADAPGGSSGEPGVPYPDNPNGSANNIAGICDPTGRVFGLMPHPEAFLFPHNHPRWTRETVPEGLGRRIFENAVRALRDASGAT
jgi:phosphoribosylformylglycinamidine synthase subunit PurQ / glutaminase